MCLYRLQEDKTMHGLPTDFNLGTFVSKALEQVCFTENQVSFHFSDDVSVTVEGPLSYAVVGQRESTKTEPPIVRSDLMRLLGARVTAATGNVEGTLTLEFDGGGIIRCYDDSKAAESYHITAQGRTFHI